MRMRNRISRPSLSFSYLKGNEKKIIDPWIRDLSHGLLDP
jgi:hypothetical protein